MNIDVYILVVGISYILTGVVIVVSNIVLVITFLSNTDYLLVHQSMNYMVISQCVMDALLGTVGAGVSAYSTISSTISLVDICYLRQIETCAFYLVCCYTAYCMLILAKECRRSVQNSLAADQFSRSQCTLIILVILVFSIIYQAPLLFVNYRPYLVRVDESAASNQTLSGVVCFVEGSALKLYAILALLLGYFVPVIVLGYIHLRTWAHIDEVYNTSQEMNRSLVRTLIGLLVLFNLCWLPQHVSTFLLAWTSNYLPIHGPPPAATPEPGDYTGDGYVYTLSYVVFLEAGFLIPLSFCWLKVILIVSLRGDLRRALARVIAWCFCSNGYSAAGTGRGHQNDTSMSNLKGVTADDCNMRGTPSHNERTTDDCNMRGTPRHNERTTDDCNMLGTPRHNERTTDDCNTRGTPRHNERTTEDVVAVDVQEDKEAETDRCREENSESW